MPTPIDTVYDGLLGYAQECLGLAEDSLSKLAAVEATLAQHDALVLTKVAGRPTLARSAEVADVLIKKGFAARGNRPNLIQGIMTSGPDDLLSLLEKTASVAICPAFALQGAEDGELVEKAAGKTVGLQGKDEIWRQALDEARAETGT